MAYPRISLYSLLLAGLLALAGCQNGQSETLGKAQPASGEVVATVNGQPITELELEVFLKQKRAKQGAANLSREAAINELVNLKLLAQEAEKEGLPKTPEFEATMALQRNTLLANEVLKQRIQDMDVTDKELRDEYERQIAGMATKEYKARHILTKSKEDAEAVIAELDKGADFAELAKQKSTGPSGANGGDLGWFRPGAMVPEFSKAVEGMKKGTYTKEPVKTQFGWHVILLEDVRELSPPAFDEVKDKLRAIVVNKKLQQYLSDLHSKAKIDIKPAAESPAAES